jgi:ABC-type sulfate/molybdate transport systems ATPase subunit
MALLQVAGVSKVQDGNTLLNDIHLEIKPSVKLAIAGETGSGKTSLLRVMAGLLQPDSGNVYFENNRLPGPDEILMPGNKRIAFLSQHFELRNHYRVEEILSYANRLSDDEANNIFDICDIQHLLKRWTHQLSGGEKQRIALARLLITSPSVLLLDEPFSNLDMIHKRVLRSVIDLLSQELGITCILVSHDPGDLLSWAHELIVMRQGKIVQQATPSEIFYRPANEYAAALFGRYNLVEAGLFSIKNREGRRLFLRPDQIRLATGPDNGITAKVEKLFFWGNYHEAILSAGNQELSMYASHPPGQGSMIRIEPDIVTPWFLPSD